MEEDVTKSEVLVTASQVLDEECLSMCMENASGSEMVSVKHSDDRLRAIVTFSKDVNVDDIKRYAEKKLSNKLSIEYLKRNNKIIVRDLPEQTAKDTVELYFESSRNCPSGGHVAHVDLYDDQHCAVVEFEDPAVVDKVLRASHTISGSRIHVESWSPLVDLTGDKASTTVVREIPLNTKKMSKATQSGAVSKTVEKSNDASVIKKTKADGRGDDKADGSGGNKAHGTCDNKADGAVGSKTDGTGGNKAHGTGDNKADDAGGSKTDGTCGNKADGAGGSKAGLSSLGSSKHSELHSSGSASRGSLSQKFVKLSSQSEVGYQQPHNSRSGPVSQQQLSTTRSTATSAVRRMEITNHIQIKCESVEQLKDIQQKLFDNGILKLVHKQCSAETDDRNLTITLTGKNQDALQKLGEIIYEGHWTTDVDIPLELGQKLYRCDKRWANYVINKNLEKGSGLFTLNNKECPVVAAFSKDVAVAGAENLKCHILCGRIAITEKQHGDYLRSTEWKKCKEDLQREKPIVILVNKKSVTVTGVPYRVIRCVGEINEKFSKLKSW